MLVFFGRGWNKGEVNANVVQIDREMSQMFLTVVPIDIFHFHGYTHLSADFVFFETRCRRKKYCAMCISITSAIALQKTKSQTFVRDLYKYMANFDVQ